MSFAVTTTSVFLVVGVVIMTVTVETDQMSIIVVRPIISTALQR